MSAIKPEDFFKTKRSISEIKSEILKQYLKAWVEYWVLNQEQNSRDLVFMDLFAGQGFAGDGKLWAFAELIQEIVDATGTSGKAIRIFYADTNKSLAEKLRISLETLPFYNQLIHLPVWLPDNANLKQIQDELADKPSLIFLDSFTHENVVHVLGQAVQQPTSDVLMLFNFSKLRSAILQAPENGPLDLFFNQNLLQIKKYYQTESSAKKKEKFTLDALETASKERGAYYFKFKVNLPDKEQTSYILIFTSKTKWGYFKIKEILKNYSDYQADNVPLFKANQKQQPPLLPGFFNYLNKYNLSTLTEELAKSKSQYHYKTIQEIYEEHSIGTYYIIENYLAAFETLRQNGRINIIDDKNKQVKHINFKSVVFYKLHGSSK